MSAPDSRRLGDVYWVLLVMMGSLYDFFFHSLDSSVSNIREWLFYDNVADSLPVIHPNIDSI